MGEATRNPQACGLRVRADPRRGSATAMDKSLPATGAQRGFHLSPFWHQPAMLLPLVAPLLLRAHTYNTVRPHQALGYATPLEELQRHHQSKPKIQKCHALDKVLADNIYYVAIMLWDWCSFSWKRFTARPSWLGCGMGGVVLDVLLEDFLVGADHSAAVDEAGGRAGDIHGFAFRHAFPH